MMKTTKNNVGHEMYTILPTRGKFVGPNSRSQI